MEKQPPTDGLLGACTLLEAGALCLIPPHTSPARLHDIQGHMGAGRPHSFEGIREALTSKAVVFSMPG